MARITRDSSVLNQFGSPSLNSNTFANRPAAGQNGRLFVSSDTFSIFRDNGIGWDQISGSSTLPDLQQVTGVGNTTTLGINQISGNGIFSGTDILQKPSFNFAFSGFGYSQFVGDYTSQSPVLQIGSYLQNNFAIIAGGVSTLSSFINANFSELVLTVSSNIAVDISVNNSSLLGLLSIKGAGGGTITMNQSGIRALSPIISKTNYLINTAPVTISHYAGLVLYGPEGFAGTQVLTFSNYYCLYVGSTTQFAINPNYTNRFGIYQSGPSDKNYYAGDVLIKTTTATGRALVINGNMEIQTTTDSGAHPPTVKHLPIYIKEGTITTLYYLQLLS